MRQEATPVGPARLTARFLGTTTIVLSDGRTTIMTDGFFSRPTLKELLNGAVTPNLENIRAALNAGNVANISAIFVAHSHHDHAMDAPYVAHMTGAAIVGSASTMNIALGVDFPKQMIKVIEDGSTCRFGDFTVTAFKTPHSWPNPLSGHIQEPLGRSARALEYREGDNFTFHVAHPLGNVLIVPSLGVRRGWSVPKKADVVFLGVGGLTPPYETFKSYWDQFVVPSGAATVYPIHWDDFLAPPDLKAGPGVPRRLRKKMSLLRKMANGKRVEVPHYAAAILLSDRKSELHDRNLTTEEGCWPVKDADDGPH